MGLNEFTVKDSSSLALGQKGCLTVTDTNVHYGRYVALTFLEDTVFDTAGLVNELSTLANGFSFTSGGTTEVTVGKFLLGATSGAIVQVKAITLTSGSWAGGNAAGWMIAEPVNSTGTTAAENMGLCTVSNQDNGTPVAALVTANVLTTGSEAAGGVTTGDTQIGETFPGGSTIYGLFTKILLASGALIAYKA